MSQNKIDQYIEDKPEFAQPILLKLRELIHQASPNIEEAIKWNQPCFSHHGLVCAMASFKAHVSFSFFEGKHLVDHDNIFDNSDCKNLATLKFKTLDDLPDEKKLISFIKQAITYNNSAEKPKKKSVRKDKADLVIPNDLTEALAKNKSAKQHFDNFSYTKQKDYIDWITSAKRETTREKRLATTIEWVSEGKGKNWKYENC